MKIIATSSSSATVRIILDMIVGQKDLLIIFNSMSGFVQHFGFLFTCLALSQLPVCVGRCQVVEPGYSQLNLADKGKKIENIICLDISRSDYGSIKEVTGKKRTVKARLLIINGDTLNPEKISTRGKTTLYYRRKSYNFSLNSPASFYHGKGKVKLKKFFVLGLSMDRCYCNNRLAFEMMKESKLFHLFYTFCELRINGETQGVCMIVERPEDWALKEEKSIFLIRRGYNNVIDKIKGGKKADREDIKKYRGYFVQLYRNLNKYEGEEFSKIISERLDLNNYMRWLAFNFFVRNGDYTDEAYFYVDPDNDKFRIIPWDYDDIFALFPHEGIEQNRKIIGDKMFFSIEDNLDRKIVSDPYLYKLYLVQLEDLLTRLSPEVIKDICENTYAELYPYYLNNEIISQKKYDRYKDVSLDGLKTNIQKIYDQLIMSRSIYLKSIEDQL